MEGDTCSGRFRPLVCCMHSKSVTVPSRKMSAVCWLTALSISRFMISVLGACPTCRLNISMIRLCLLSDGMSFPALLISSYPGMICLWIVSPIRSLSGMHEFLLCPEPHNEYVGCDVEGGR
jgi:hypothetical protein